MDGSTSPPLANAQGPVALPVDGDRKPRPFSTTPFDESAPPFRRTHPGWRLCPMNRARLKSTSPRATARRQTADLDWRRHDAALAKGRPRVVLLAAESLLMAVPVEPGVTMQSAHPTRCSHSPSCTPRARARETNPSTSRRRAAVPGQHPGRRAHLLSDHRRPQLDGWVAAIATDGRDRTRGTPDAGQS